jgi:hypothetical protein
LPVLVLLQGEFARSKSPRWSAVAVLCLQFFLSVALIDLILFFCYADLLDAPLPSMALLSPQRRACCIVFKFCCKGSLLQPFPPWILELHSSYRAARGSHRCALIRHICSRKDRSGALETPLQEPFYDLLQGECAPRFHRHPIPGALGPLISRATQCLPSRAAWFQIAPH